MASETAGSMRLKPGMTLVKEVKTIVGVIFPRVFTIQNDADDWRFITRCVLGNRFDLVDKMPCRIFAMPARILKTNQIRQTVITEKATQAIRTLFQLIRAVQILRVLRNGLLHVMQTID